MNMVGGGGKKEERMRGEWVHESVFLFLNVGHTFSEFLLIRYQMVF